MGQDPIRICERNYMGWSEALWLEQGPLVLVLVPQVGGRIMALRWKEEDIYWANPDLGGRSVDLSAYPHPQQDKVKLGFLLWGGDKTWLAPQDRWPNGLPLLDLDSGPYSWQIASDPDSQRVAVTLTSPICRESGAQITRTLLLNTDAPRWGWSMSHRLENKGDQPMEWGLWDVTMVQQPATVYLPISQASAYPEGIRVFEQEGDSIRARSEVVSVREEIAVIDCQPSLKFKFGVDGAEGSLMVARPLQQGGHLGLRKIYPTGHPQPYAHGCTTEVFNASEYPYLEVEIHSPLQTLKPGQSFEFVESTQLKELERLPTSAAEIRATMPF